MDNSNDSRESIDLIEHFDFFSQQNLVGIMLIQGGRIVRVNDVVANSIGLKTDDLIGTDITEFANYVKPNQRDFVREQILKKQSGFTDDIVSSYIIECEVQDGKTLWLELYSRTIEFEGGTADLVVMLDVTEKKTAEIALNEANFKYKLLLENQTDLIIKCDSKFRIQYVNENFKQAFGKSEDELMGSDCIMLAHEDDRARIMSSVQLLYDPPHHNYHEVRTKTADGIRWFAWSNKAIINESGEVEGFVGVGRDITDRKWMENSLRKSQQHLEQASELALLGSWEWISATNEYVWSNELFNLFGIEKGESEVTSDLFYQIVHPDDRKKVFQGMQEFMYDKISLDIEYRFIKQDSKEIRYAHARAQMSYDLDGSPVRSIGTVQDITDRKKIEEELKHRELILKEAERISKMGSFEWDIANDRMTFSDEWRRLHGIKNSDLTLEQLMPIAHPDDIPKIKSAFDDALKGKSDYRVEHRIIKQDTREIRTVAAVGKVIRDDDGRPIKMFGTGQDITDRIETQKELRESEQRHRTLFENMAQGVFYQLPDGTIEDANRAALEIFGLPREQFLGRTSEHAEWKVIRKDGSAVPGEEHPSMIALRTGKAVRDSLLGVHNPVRDEYVWITINAIPQFKEGESEPYRVAVTVHDLTDIVEAERALINKQSELEQIFEAIPDAIIYADTSRRIIKVNRAFVELFGYTPEEVYGQETKIIYTEEGNFKKQGRLRYNVDARDVYEIYEIEYRKKNGEVFLSETVGTPVRDAEDNPVGFLGIVRDITERKKAENALKESEERFRTVAEFTYDWEFWISPGKEFLFVSPSCERVTGYSPREFIDDFSLLEAITHKDDKHIIEEHFSEISDEVDVRNFDFRIITKNGEVRWISHFCQPVYSRDGVFLGRRASNRDITDRREAEQALYESEKRFRNIYNKTPVMLHSIDSDGLITNVSDYWLEVMGYKRDEVIGRKSVEFLTEQSRKYAREVILPDFYKNGFCNNVYYQFAKKNGEVIDVLLSAVVEKDSEGNYVRSLAVITDITERIKVEKALQESEERFRNTYNKTPVMLHSIDRNDVLLNVSDYWLEALGYTRDEVLGRKSVEFLTEESRKFAEEVILPDFYQSGVCENVPFQMIKKDGEILDVLLSATVEKDSEGNYLRSLAVITDITDLKAAEEQARLLQNKLIQSEKMAVIGRMVSGVAHEINNPLTALKGRLESLIKKESPGGLNHDHLIKIQKAANRIEEIVECMLVFAQTETVTPTELDLNRVVEESVVACKDKYNWRKIRLVNELHDELPVIHGDRNQLINVLENLFSNAIEAMNGEGTLSLSTGKTVTGDSLFIKVKDTGKGMSEDEQLKLFTPFHTKGRIAVGRGLGLAMCYGIMKSHGGDIEVKSSPGNGSTFTLKFPLKYW
ncbi:MAG: PAS domain S-box protein [candidate division Zixibacteria bacterium]|nr:PAS domain S-box protein [candidate division Zixibacteria bacterium]